MCSTRTIKLAFLLLASFFLLSAPTFSFADIYGFQDHDGYWRFAPPSSERDSVYEHIIEQAATRFQVEASLIKAIIKAESDFLPTAVSQKGARGLMQLMPHTADTLNVADPFDAEQNIFAGVRYFSLLLQRFGRNKTLALAAYNAGPEEVETHGKVPPYPETETFVQRVLHYYSRYRGGHR